MNYQIVLRVLGKLLVGYTLAMMIPLIMAVINKETSVNGFICSVAITGFLGFGFVILNYILGSVKKNERMGTREGFVIVATGWIITSLLGALPYWFADIVPTYLDAVFESVSGLTTTGASVISNVEILPASILLWRSLTHWLGGIGIIVIFIILLPNSGFGAVHLFNAEVPGPLNKRIMPRIRDTAIALWRIYLTLTIILTALLTIAGMSLFDAVNHAFSTIATGGFSTKNNSIMYYDSLSIELIVALFIILAGISFRVYLMAWRSKSLDPFKNTELYIYLLLIFGSTLLIAGGLWLEHDSTPHYAFRHALFQVASLITGTGFASSDYDQWPSMVKLVLFFLMFSGGCAGSTTGGIKISRILILVKSVWMELKRAVHPRAVSTIKMEGKAVEQNALNTVGLFFFLYITVFVIASIMIAGTGLEPFDAISAVAASLGNVGPGFGIVGPTTTFAGISLFGKFILTLCMLLGRLEFITLLILLRPEFWRPKKSW